MHIDAGVAASGRASGGERPTGAWVRATVLALATLAVPAAAQERPIPIMQSGSRGYMLEVIGWGEHSLATASSDDLLSWDLPGKVSVEGIAMPPAPPIRLPGVPPNAGWAPKGIR